MIDYLVSKVKDKFNAFVEKSVPNFDPNFFSTRRQLISPTGSYSFDQPYNQSVWIHSASKKIASSVSQSPYVFYTESPSGEKEELSKNHELNQLFDNPNPFMSRQEIMFTTMIYLLIDGEAFWVLDRGDITGKDITSFPNNVWCFRKNFFTPEIDKKSGMIKFWRFEGEPKILRNENVIHFKYFNPDSHYEGLAPWMAAGLSSEQDYYASNYNTNFFKSGAAIGGFVEVEESLGNDEYDRLLSSIEDRHAGHTKSHRLMLLEGGAKFKEAKLSQRDMEFIESKKLTKSEILAVYGTNIVVLGDFNDVKSEAGVRAILKDFWTSVVIPNQDYLENKIYSKLLAPYNASIKMYFDNSSIEILQKDLDTLLERAKKFMDLGYTTNQINRRLDLQMPEIEDGNVSYVPTSLRPVDQAMAEAEASEAFAESFDEEESEEETENQAAADQTTQTTEEDEDDNLTKSIKKMAKAIDKRKREQREFERDQRRYEKKFLRATKQYFKDQEKRVLQFLEDVPLLVLIAESGKSVNGKVKGIIDDILKEKVEAAELLTTFTPLWEAAYEEGLETVAENLGLLEVQFNPLSPLFLKFQEFKVRKIAPSIVNTVREGVRDALKEGLKEQETIQQIAARIKDVYAVADKRAITIARTESTSSLNSGRLDMYKNPDANVEKIRWITARDENVRSSHEVLDGQTAKPGDRFVTREGVQTMLRHPGDMQAPASDVINCRCVVVEDFGED